MAMASTLHAREGKVSAARPPGEEEGHGLQAPRGGGLRPARHWVRAPGSIPGSGMSHRATVLRMPYSVTVCKTCEYLTDSPEHGPEDQYCEAPDGFETIELFTEREVQARLATAQLESELKEEVRVHGLQATLEAGARITLEDGYVVSVPLRVAADGVGVMLRVDAQVVAEQVRARIEGRAEEDDMPHWVTLDGISFRGGGVMSRRRGQ